MADRRYRRVVEMLRPVASAISARVASASYSLRAAAFLSILRHCVGRGRIARKWYGFASRAVLSDTPKRAATSRAGVAGLAVQNARMEARRPRRVAVGAVGSLHGVAWVGSVGRSIFQGRSSRRSISAE